MDIDVDDEAEDELARYSVIDGQQRLTAIYNFFSGSYALQSLEVLSELNGSYYKDLPPFLIRRLEERTICCLRIDSTVYTQVKFDIFERLNSGSVKLEAQELRNATCRGPFKDLIKELAKNPIFAEVANLDPDSTLIKKMEDEELVLRFFAVSHDNGYLEYKGQFKKFLTNKMVEFNKLDAATLKDMKDSFIRTMKLVKEHFGSKPFAKYKKPDGQDFVLMSSFNAAVFDAIAFAFSKPDLKNIPSYNNFLKLFNEPVFFEAVEGSVNDVSKLNNRIRKAQEVIA